MNSFWKNLKENFAGYRGNKAAQQKRGNSGNVSGMQFDKAKGIGKQASDDKKFFSREVLPLILFVWLFVAGFYGVIIYEINQIAGEFKGKNWTGSHEPGQEYSSPVYKPGIYIINSLKHTKYLKYIQSIYVNPHEKHKIMIMIKPNYWGALSEEEKDEMSREVLKKWKEIYKNMEYSEFFEAEAHYANTR
ncbi:MAG: hypothetical protein GX568_10070 [Candidatus Gastranaerophilales bacterium]|nr:hypothetical protein [Candidatus Gastranaerophilales bacterium]